MKKYFGSLYHLFKTVAKSPRVFGREVKAVPPKCSSHGFSETYTETVQGTGDHVPFPANPLWEYFQAHREGHGIWKWVHYFDIYHRHFARFIGKKVNVLEIGVYSGGSLGMWRSYFGEKSHIYGVDIEDACKEYENDHTSIFIGDQADRAFWGKFRESAERIDILIDDGGHTPEQQQITLEEMLPNLRPGGVYLCEDIHGCFNKFSAFASILVQGLNRVERVPGSLLHQSAVSSFQSEIHSIHFYPYVMVIEKHAVQSSNLTAPKHGTQWQPFF